MKKNFVIETERLVLRHFQEGDAEDMFKNYCSIDKVTENLIWSTHPNIEATKAYLQTVLDDYAAGLADFRFAIVWKETNEVIGVIDYMKRRDYIYEIGWVIGDKYWGKGIMPEAANATLPLVFDSGVVRIQAKHFVGNEKSGRVMQKIGMTHEGTLRCFAMDGHGRIRDTEMYALINPNYPNLMTQNKKNEVK